MTIIAFIIFFLLLGRWCWEIGSALVTGRGTIRRTRGPFGGTLYVDKE